MSQFDTFLFDERLFDDPGTPPGSFYAVIVSRNDWTAAINIGNAPLESAPNPAAG